MKKIFLLIVLVIAFIGGASAQSWKNALGKIAGEVVGKVTGESSDDSGVIGSVVNDLVGKVTPVTMEALVGTWDYQGSACELDSDNALADIGGSAVSDKLEDKLDGYLKKIGVAKGSCTFTFAEDSTCVFKIKSREINGSYELLPDEKIINFSFVMDKLNMKAHVSYSITEMNIVFEADKLLALLQKTLGVVTNTAGKLSSSSKVGGAASTLSTISALLESYEGMMLGMELKKQQEK